MIAADCYECVCIVVPFCLVNHKQIITSWTEVIIKATLYC